MEILKNVFTKFYLKNNKNFLSSFKHKIFKNSQFSHKNFYLEFTQQPAPNKKSRKYHIFSQSILFYNSSLLNRNYRQTYRQYTSNTDGSNRKNDSDQTTGNNNPNGPLLPPKNPFQEKNQLSLLAWLLENAKSNRLLAGLINGLILLLLTQLIQSFIRRQAELKEIRSFIDENFTNINDALIKIISNILKYQSCLELSYSQDENIINELRKENLNFEYLLKRNEILRQRLDSYKSYIRPINKQIRELEKDLNNQKIQLTVAKSLNHALLYIKLSEKNKAQIEINNIFNFLKIPKIICNEFVNQRLDKIVQYLPQMSNGNMNDVILIDNIFNIHSEIPNKPMLFAAVYNLRGMLYDDIASSRNLSKAEKSLNHKYALVNFIEALQYDTSNGHIWSNLAFILGHIPEYRHKSVRCHRHAYKLEPNSASILNGYALALHEFEKSNMNFEKALLLFDSALNLVPNSYVLLKNKSKLLIKMGKVDEAEQYLKIVLKNRPKDRETILYLGIALANQDKKREALKFLEAAYSYYPDDFILLYQLGLLHQELNKQKNSNEQALNEFERSLKSLDNSKNVYKYRDNDIIFLDKDKRSYHDLKKDLENKIIKLKKKLKTNDNIKPKLSVAKTYTIIHEPFKLEDQVKVTALKERMIAEMFPNEPEQKINYDKHSKFVAIKKNDEVIGLVRLIFENKENPNKSFQVNEYENHLKNCHYKDFQKNTVEISRVYIDKVHRGSGGFLTLLKGTLELCRKNNITHFFSMVDPALDHKYQKYSLFYSKCSEPFDVSYYEVGIVEAIYFTEIKNLLSKINNAEIREYLAPNDTDDSKIFTPLHKH